MSMCRDVESNFGNLVEVGEVAKSGKTQTTRDLGWLDTLHLSLSLSLSYPYVIGYTVAQQESTDNPRPTTTHGR
jgi:hypothetical protein